MLMTEYRFHWWPGSTPTPPPSMSLQAESHRHGAALALRHFVDLGCDIAAPLAHLDISEPDGLKQTLLVDELLEWLHAPQQAEFVQREDLSVLLDSQG